jgi:hypothetical protein
MDKLDVNGWEYGRSRIEDLAQKVRQTHPEANLVTDAGGKVFGLSLAAALLGDLFTVPLWFGWKATDALPDPGALKRLFGAGSSSAAMLQTRTGSIPVLACTRASWSASTTTTTQWSIG